MTRAIHDLQQGTPEWHAFRRQHYNASDAAAMLGVSPYKTRDQLLHEYATGITAEVSASQERLFAKGHELEARARAAFEQQTGIELFPVVMSYGKLAASLDGLSEDGEVAFEHKTLNQEIRDTVDTELPLHYRVQMEQQLIVSGALQVHFVASNEQESVSAVYDRDSTLANQIVQGWEQFERDLSEFKVDTQPTVIANSPERLPALFIQATGTITASNLAEFRDAALSVFRDIKTDLQTDQDFADADKTAKWCADIEERIQATKAAVLAQTASIAEVFSVMDSIHAEARDKRLVLSKLIKSRKEQRKAELVQLACDDLRKHINALEIEVHGIVGVLPMRTISADFAQAIKGMSSIDSMQRALNSALIQAKSAADAQAHIWRTNAAWFTQEAREHRLLFADMASLLGKPHEDFQAVVKARIAQAAELAAQKAEQQAAESAEKAVWFNIAKAAQQDAAQAEERAEERARNADRATLTLGDMNERLTPLKLTADSAAKLGIVHLATNKSAKLYSELQFGHLCDAIVRLVMDAKEQAYERR